MRNHRYEVLFGNAVNGQIENRINVMCDTWTSVEREVAAFGVENLIHIRENQVWKL
jgi:hypothetical protein